MKLEAGDRVRVLAHWNWPFDCTGRVEEPPKSAPLVGEGGGTWQGCRRVVQGRKGPIESFWVTFDEPQRDGDGDGPYRAGEVESEFLRRWDA